MLIKKIYIMKGENAKSILKINLLENKYAEVDLQTHHTYNEVYTFILKSGSFIHIENFSGRRFKKTLQPFNLDNVHCAVACNGKILVWTAPTPKIPMQLSELALKYSVYKQKKNVETISLSNSAQNNGEPNDNETANKNECSFIRQESTENTNYLDKNPILDVVGDNSTINDNNIPYNYNNSTLCDVDSNDTTLCDVDSNDTTLCDVDSNDTTLCDVDSKNSTLYDPNSHNSTNDDNKGLIDDKNQPQNNLCEVKDITKEFNIIDVSTTESQKQDNEFITLITEIENKYNLYPHNEILEKLFPDSKWISENEDNISLGLLYSQNKITHICYAKKGKKDELFDENSSYYEGYHIVFNENL